MCQQFENSYDLPWLTLNHTNAIISKYIFRPGIRNSHSNDFSYFAWKQDCIANIYWILIYSSHCAKHSVNFYYYFLPFYRWKNPRWTEIKRFVQSHSPGLRRELEFEWRVYYISSFYPGDKSLNAYW